MLRTVERYPDFCITRYRHPVSHLNTAGDGTGLVVFVAVSSYFIIIFLATEGDGGLQVKLIGIGSKYILVEYLGRIELTVYEGGVRQY